MVVKVNGESKFNLIINNNIEYKEIHRIPSEASVQDLEFGILCGFEEEAFLTTFIMSEKTWNDVEKIINPS